MRESEKVRDEVKWVTKFRDKRYKKKEAMYL